MLVLVVPVKVMTLSCKWYCKLKLMIIKNTGKQLLHLLQKQQVFSVSTVYVSFELNLCYRLRVSCITHEHNI